MQRAGNTPGATLSDETNSVLTCHVRHNYSGDLSTPWGAALAEPPTCATLVNNPRCSETERSRQRKLRIHERPASGASHKSAI